MMMLGDSLGGILANRGKRTFEQSALGYFKDKEITPEALQEFSAMFPNVSQEEIYQKAAKVSQLIEAEEVKNIGSAILNARVAGTFNDPKKIEPFLQSLPGRMSSKMKAAQMASELWKSLSPDQISTFEHDAKNDLLQKDRYGNITPAPGVAPGTGAPVEIYRTTPEGTQKQKTYKGKLPELLNADPEGEGFSKWQMGDFVPGKEETASPRVKEFQDVSKMTVEEKKAYYKHLLETKEKPPSVVIHQGAGKAEKPKYETWVNKTTGKAYAIDMNDKDAVAQINQDPDMVSVGMYQKGVKPGKRTLDDLRAKPVGAGQATTPSKPGFKGLW